MVAVQRGIRAASALVTRGDYRAALVILRSLVTTPRPQRDEPEQLGLVLALRHDDPVSDCPIGQGMKAWQCASRQYETQKALGRAKGQGRQASSPRKRGVFLEYPPCAHCPVGARVLALVRRD